MTPNPKPAHTPAREHSVPWFWPFAAAVEMAESAPGSSRTT